MNPWSLIRNIRASACWRTLAALALLVMLVLPIIEGSASASPSSKEILKMQADLDALAASRPGTAHQTSPLSDIGNLPLPPWPEENSKPGPTSVMTGRLSRAPERPTPRATAGIANGPSPRPGVHPLKTWIQSQHHQEQARGTEVPVMF